MPSEREAKSRLRRLEQGSRRADDLDAVLSWLRGRIRGKYPLIEDIADFGAHGDLRDRGALVERSELSLRNAKISVIGRDEKRRGVPSTISLEERKWIFRKSLDRLSNEEVQERFGRGKAGVRQDLEAALKAVLGLLPNDGWEMARPLKKREVEVLREIASKAYMGSAYSLEALLNELRGALVEFDLFNDLQARLFVEEYADFIGAYIVSKMHLADLAYPSGHQSTLSASIGGEGCLWVSNVFVAGVVSSTQVWMSLPAFVTDLNAELVCEPAARNVIEANSDLPLHLNNNGKLALFSPFSPTGPGDQDFVRRIPIALTHLAKFPDPDPAVRIQIRVYSRSDEARAFGAQIEAALRAGGWNAAQFGDDGGTRTIRGVQIEVRNTEAPPLVASELVVILNRLGIAAEIAEWSDFPDGFVRIAIGSASL